MLKDNDCCAVFGVSHLVHIVVCMGACVYALLISPGFLPSVAWFARLRAPPRWAEPYVSAASTQFRAILFTPNLSSLPPTLPRPVRLFIFFCAGVFHSFVSPGHLSHPSSFYPPPPRFLRCQPFAPQLWLLPPPSPFHPSLSFLFSLFPYGLVQMSDQTEQHDSQRLAEFPLVRPVAIKQHCVPNLKPALRNMKHWQTKLWLG